MARNWKYKRKKILVFGFEGKNNKTETLYFSNFKPYNGDYIIKKVSCGCTDPVNMLKSIKSKRKAYDYNSRDDQTFLFVDTDGDSAKNQLIETLNKKTPNDIHFIASSPIFELWFLNHFKHSCKEYADNQELINELRKYIPYYEKNLDIFSILNDKIDIAIRNSKTQIEANKDMCKTDVYLLFENKIIKK